MGITKADLIENISETTGLNKSRSAKVFETLLETMKQTLESGEEILVRGFGKFSVKDNNGRKKTNCQSRDELVLDAMRVVVFKSSLVLTKKMNEK